MKKAVEDIEGLHSARTHINMHARTHTHTHTHTRTHTHTHQEKPNRTRAIENRLKRQNKNQQKQTTVLLQEHTLGKWVCLELLVKLEVACLVAASLLVSALLTAAHTVVEAAKRAKPQT